MTDVNRIKNKTRKVFALPKEKILKIILCLCTVFEYLCLHSDGIRACKITLAEQ